MLLFRAQGEQSAGKGIKRQASPQIYRGFSPPSMETGQENVLDRVKASSIQDISKFPIFQAD